MTQSQTAWDAKSVISTYSRFAGESVASRVVVLMDWAQSNGRAMFGRSVTPAFGIIGNRGQRILSVREHFRATSGKPYIGRVTLFPGGDRYLSINEQTEVKAALLGLAMPAANSANQSSWDVTSLAVMSKDEFDRLLQLLEWLGPATASDAEPRLPTRLDSRISRIVRDSAATRKLKALYKNKCQLCGEVVGGELGWEYSEAHHIRPLGRPHNGPDAEDNLVVVCPNDHARLDYGAIRINPRDLTLLPGHRIDIRHIDYHNAVVCRSD